MTNENSKQKKSGRLNNRFLKWWDFITLFIWFFYGIKNMDFFLTE